MSKKIWEKNIKALEKWYPLFAKLVQDKKNSRIELENDRVQNNIEEVEVMTELSWDGETIFRIEKEGRKLYLGGKRNAKEPVQIWLELLGKLNKYAPVFLFGLGNGAYLKALVKNTDKEVNIVAYEPSVHIFLSMLEKIDLSEEIEDRPVAFIVEGINESEFVPVMNKVVAVECMNFLREKIHPNYRVFYGEKILKYVKILQRFMENIRVNYNTGVLFAGDLAKNVLHNMKYICDGYSTKKLFESIPHDKPAILVAAGPSLNKNIMDLKRAKNKAFILAVDTAIKPLVKAGIIPDAFITIDPHKPLDLIEIDGAEEIPVIAPTSSHYTLIERQKGKKIFFFDGYLIPFRIYQKNGKAFYNVSGSGSVACYGFSLLFKMGFNTIILVGQDLAYSNNRSHADGTFSEKMKEENTENMIMVKGNYEEKVPTLLNLRMYLEWFEKYIEGMKKLEKFHIINATEGGAYIEGTELMTLKDAIEETCVEEFSFETCIAEMESEFTEDERRKAVEYLHMIPEKYNEIIKNAKLLKKAYQSLEKNSKSANLNKENNLKILKRIKKYTKKCHENDGFQLVEMTMPSAEYIIRSEYYYEGENAAEEMQEAARKGIKYSELLQMCAELLKEMAEETLLPIPLEKSESNS